MKPTTFTKSDLKKAWIARGILYNTSETFEQWFNESFKPQKTTEEIEGLFSNLSYGDMYTLHGILGDITRKKFNTIYKVLKFINVQGNISGKIREETRLSCTWEGVNGTCGELKLIVPIEKCTEEFEEDILTKYDSYYKK